MSKNERSRSVKKQTAENKDNNSQPTTDLRVRRTRNRLGSALIALILEKPIDEITVQEVLDRAAVGRSTFYVHYTDKDDLFLSQLEQGLEMWSTALSRRREKSLRVAPVRDFFAHIDDARKLYRALVESGRIQAFFDLAQGYFARGIAQRLREQSMRFRNLPQAELGARSHVLAGSLLSLLRWWMDRGAKESPQSMDELFHRIVWRGMQ
jgi:AcrR family transcriptional regulator